MGYTISDTSVEHTKPIPVLTHPTVESASQRMMEVLPLVFRQLLAAARREMPEMAAEAGESQYRIILLLKLRDFTISDLAECLHVRTPTVSRMIDSLVERGYVVRQPDATDRRKVWVRLTPTGHTLASRMEATFHRVVSRFLHPLDEGDLSTLIAAFNTLESLLERDPLREAKPVVSS